MKEQNFEISLANVDSEGKVSPEEILSLVRPDTILVSVMLVQNEVGTVQPCKSIGEKLSRLGAKRPKFHVDGVQGFAKMPVDVGTFHIDLFSASAHKISGPKGVGFLYVKRTLDIPPLLFGGGQEGNMRSGTENVPAIAGFAAACRLWGDKERVTGRMKDLRKRLVGGIERVWPESIRTGPRPGSSNEAPHIAHFAFPGFAGETLLHALEDRGVYVSTGSACSSHNKKPSSAVLALGRPESEALSSIRFSMSRYTTEDEIDEAVKALKSALKSLSAWRQKT